MNASLVLIAIAELIYVIPFRDQPVEVLFLIVPFAYLGVFVVHLLVIRKKLNDFGQFRALGNTQESMSYSFISQLSGA